MKREVESKATAEVPVGCLVLLLLADTINTLCLCFEAAKSERFTRRGENKPLPKHKHAATQLSGSRAKGVSVCVCVCGGGGGGGGVVF